MPDNSPPRFYPVQFHPEFGYLAPTLRFRSKLSLVGKGVAFGLIVGIIVAIAVSPDRQERVAVDAQHANRGGDERLAGHCAAPVCRGDGRRCGMRVHPGGRLALPAAVTPAPQSCCRASGRPAGTGSKGSKGDAQAEKENRTPVAAGSAVIGAPSPIRAAPMPDPANATPSRSRGGIAAGHSDLAGSRCFVRRTEIDRD